MFYRGKYRVDAAECQAIPTAGLLPAGVERVLIPAPAGNPTRRLPGTIGVDYDLCVLIEEPGEELRGKVEEAVRLCPRQALSLQG